MLPLLQQWLARFRRTPPPARPFVPDKGLCERDKLIINMLNSQGHEHVSFCITDPALEDNPVIYISGGFAALTGYQPKDVEGKNCRFLQGPETVKSDVLHIKEAIKEERDCNVHLLNHKKDGTVFANEFFLTTLKTPENDVAYFIGIQADAMESGLARRRKSGVGVAGAGVAEDMLSSFSRDA